jgi:hypothetical protein
MRFLIRSHDESETIRIVALLETKGIACYVQSERQFQALYKAAVFVCFESQYKDALAVLADPNHSIDNPIDVEQFKAFREGRDHSRLLKLSVLWLVGAALFLAAATYLTMR